MNVTTATASIVTLLALAMNCSAQVQGFIESFSGEGAFQDTEGVLQGLDNDGWQLFTADGASNDLTQEGWSFGVEASPGRVDFQRLQRTIFGAGSFSERLEFAGLDLGEVTPRNEWDTGGGISIEHLFEDRFDVETSFRVALAEPAEPEDSWLFSIQHAASSRVDFAAVPKFSDVAIEISYDQDASRVEASFQSTDDAQPGVSISIPIDFGLSSQSIVRFESLSRGTNPVQATMNSWVLSPTSDVLGDFNLDGSLDVGDLNDLNSALRDQGDVVRFDVNQDGTLDFEDVVIWIRDLKQTYFGDADLDGEFASSDLVSVFTAGKYEDDIDFNSTWSTGDWNGDGDFTSSDLVLAFQDGGYEQGPRVASSVPEPTAMLGLSIGLAWLSHRRRNVR